VSLGTYWAAFAAGAVASLIPNKARSTGQRVGLATVAFAAVALVTALWPTDAMPAVGSSASEWPHLLNLLVFAPIVGGVAVMFLPRQNLALVRGFTLAIMALTFVASLWTLGVPMTEGWHFQYTKEWLPSIGVRYHVALDGISLWLVLLTTFITPIATYAAFSSIKVRVKELCVALLVLEGAMLGVFVALDLFLFYVFWELVLVPMYVMIGVWGGADRVKAAVKFFIYTMAGSMLMLAAILYLVWVNQKLTGQWTFDYLALSRVMLPHTAQLVCFLAFSIAFFIKVPMWPLHTWLPDAHVQAPTAGSVILAAVMLKLGTYAYLRFSMGLFPGVAHFRAANLAGIAILGGILYGALVAWKQQDVKKLVAYSSVAHLGYVMLGLFGATTSGVEGAVLQMVNHGVSTGALFMLVGVIYDRRHTRNVDDFGGLAKVMPIYAAVFLVVTFASIGVPGTNGFVGEFMVISGTYVSEALGAFAGMHTIGAAAGVILAAVYMLGVVQKMFFGPNKNPKNQHLPDLTARETLAVAPLVAMIFVIGLFPNVFLDRMKDTIASTQQQFERIARIGESVGEGPARLLPADAFSAAFMKGAPAPPEGEAKPAEARADAPAGAEAAR
jgi:NADH-quinone oxidoreductase subunit M